MPNSAVPFAGYQSVADMTNAASLAWLAASWDGEGCIRLPVERTSIQATATFVTTDGATAQLVNNMLAVNSIEATLRRREQRNPRHRPFFQIVVRHLSALHRLAETLLPYSVTKRHHLSILRAYTASRLEKSSLDERGCVRRGGGQRGKVTWAQTIPYTEDELSLAGRLSMLNQRGPAVDQLAPLGDTLRLRDHLFEIQLCWVAGLFDAEGTISFIKGHCAGQRGGYTYIPNIAIQIADAETIGVAASILAEAGIEVRRYTYPEDNPLRHRDGHHLKISALHTVAAVVPLLAPRAVTKAEHWRLMGAFIESRSDQLLAGGHVRRGRANRPLSQDEVMLAEALRRLHQ